MSGLVSLALLLQEPAPFVRARLEPDATVTVGQPVSVVVEVLVPAYFMGAPQFAELDLSDALVLFEPRGVNFTERVDAETFAGQSRRYTIYPQRAGRYEIPEVSVGVRYFGGSGATDATVSTPPIIFEATIPPEAEGLGYFIATSRLTLEERLEPEAGGLRVGDALRRTVNVTVEGALSMVIPPIAFEPIPGLGVYPDPPVVRDEGGARGQMIVGTRVDSASYVAEREGRYELPAIELSWWNVDSGRLERTSAGAIELDVIPNPDLATEFALPPEELSEEPKQAVGRVSILDRPLRYGGFFLILALALLFTKRFGRRLLARPDNVETEVTFFQRFEKAALADDARATARTLMFWLDQKHDGAGVATFREFAEVASDRELDDEARALGDILYAERPTGTGPAKRSIAVWPPRARNALEPRPTRTSSQG